MGVPATEILWSTAQRLERAEVASRVKGIRSLGTIWWYSKDKHRSVEEDQVYVMWARAHTHTVRGGRLQSRETQAICLRRHN